jgi:hypothetical protein
MEGTQRSIEMSIQNYLPYQITGEEQQIELRQIAQICEPTAISSLGLKKKLTRIEVLKILIQPNLNLPDSDPSTPDLRTLLLDCAPLILPLPTLLQTLFASFSYLYTQLRLLPLTYLAESLSLLLSAHLDTLMATKGLSDRWLRFSQVAEEVIRGFMKECPGSETETLGARVIKLVKE